MVEELPYETLVYDMERDKARCLNRTSALVWRRCDGRTTVPEMAELLRRELRIPAEEAVVWTALDRLDRAHLLEEEVTLPADRGQYSRREMLRTLQRVAGISLLLPVIESIVSPLAALRRLMRYCGRVRITIGASPMLQPGNLWGVQRMLWPEGTRPNVRSTVVP